MPLEEVNETYETKMAGFEVDCADGKGEATACHYVAEFYATIKEQHERAAALFEKNCREKGFGPSCLSLGRYYLRGRGVEQNDYKALELLDKGCKGGLLPACYFQGMLLFSGLKPPGSKVDRDTIGNVTQSKAGAPAPTLTAAELAEQQKNRAKAMELFEKACNGGNSDSCYFLGNRFLQRDNPEREPAKAIAPLQRSCADNHAPSCFNLAVLFKKGDTGVPADAKLYEEYKNKTNNLVEVAAGGLNGRRMN